MNVHITEEEQLENMKRWWKENGKGILFAVIVFLAAWFGYQYYKEHAQQQAEQASATYSELLNLVQVNAGKTLAESDYTTASHLATQLKTDHASSLYAKSGALILAKFAVDANKLDAAVTELNWVLSAKPDAAIEQMTKIRLARVLMAQNQLDEALALLKSEPDAAFVSEYQEVRGDILKRQGDVVGAYKAYELAIATVGEQQQNRVMLLKMKADDVKSPAALSEEKSQ